MATLTLIRGAELVAAPWKNGGGITREVAAFPSTAGLNDFVWRVSIADVAQAGPFSRFEGVDRTLVLLSGAGMVLDETGGLKEVPLGDGTRRVQSHTLTKALDVARFDGESQIDARLIDGATRDFNLMVRRDAAQGEVDMWRGQMQQRTRRTLSADVVLLFCASGSVRLDPGDTQALQLEAGDTLRIDAPSALQCALEGAGAVLAVSIRYTPR
jgi:environmental stress-induced protein Ves